MGAVVDGGLDESSGGPQRRLGLLVGAEAAQVLEDDDRFPPDDHCEGGDETVEGGRIELRS